jgi:hypothetical protein
MEEKAVREQVRYERDDISAVFKKTSVFFNQLQPVKIINVSKQGIAICSHQVLKKNNHLELLLSFIKGEDFRLNGYVVHSFNKPSDTRYDEFIELFFDGLESPMPLPFKYGIHFEYQYPRFRDYLIESGCKNGFEVQRCDKFRLRQSDYQR